MGQKRLFSKRIVPLSWLFLIFILSSLHAAADSPEDVVQRMLASGQFDAEKATRLVGSWGEAKKSIIYYADYYKDDPEKLKILVKLSKHRIQVVQESLMKGIDDAVKEGFVRPVEAIGPTGGWKVPLTYNTSKDPVKFIKKVANADIDATMFSNSEAAEFATERAIMRLSERVIGRELGTSAQDYQLANRVLHNGEVTLFPRHPEGHMSPGFRKKFPVVELEAYQGRPGQAALEVQYLANKKKGLADIIHYGPDGKIARVLPDQPAESIIENLSKARYTRLHAIDKIQQDYTLKYLRHVQQQSLQGDDRVELAAKMVGRMFDEETAISGVKYANTDLYQRASKVKYIMRNFPGERNAAKRMALLKQALGTQSTDDFVGQAEKQMRMMWVRNSQRAAWMRSDSLGTPAESQLNTVLRGLSIAGHGLAGVDAYLKAEEGDKVNKVAKALAWSITAEVAGSATGSAVMSTGTALGWGTTRTALTGLAGGVVAGMLAGYLVNETWTWTEDGVRKILGDYKASDTVKKMFLSNEMIAGFPGMTSEEIRDYIEKEWKHYEFGGTYVGKMTGEAAEIKKKIFEEAMGVHFQLNQRKLTAQIYAQVLYTETSNAVRLMDNDELTPEDLIRLEYELGPKFLNRTIMKKLMEEPQYARYRELLEGFDAEGGRRGLWDHMKRDLDARSPDEIRRDIENRYQTLVGRKDYILEVFDSFEVRCAEFRVASQAMIGPDELAGYLKRARMTAFEARDEIDKLRQAIELYLTDVEKLYGQLDDLSRFHYEKSRLSRELASLYELLSQAYRKMDDSDRLMKMAQKVIAIDRDPRLAGLIGSSLTPENERKVETTPGETERVEAQPETPVIVGIVIHPSSAEIHVNESVRLTATALDAGGIPIKGGPRMPLDFQWAVTGGTVVRPSAQGGAIVLTGLKPGTAGITCRAGKAEGGAIVSVSKLEERTPILSDLIVKPGSATITVDQSIRFYAAPRGADGQLLPPDQVGRFHYEWMVNDPSIANISGYQFQGAVDPIKPGTITVICKAGGAMGVAQLVIEESASAASSDDASWFDQYEEELRDHRVKKYREQQEAYERQREQQMSRGDYVEWQRQQEEQDRQEWMNIWSAIRQNMQTSIENASGGGGGSAQQAREKELRRAAERWGLTPDQDPYRQYRQWMEEVEKRKGTTSKSGSHPIPPDQPRGSYPEESPDAVILLDQVAPPSD